MVHAVPRTIGARIGRNRQDAKSAKNTPSLLRNRRDAEAQRILLFSLRLCVSAVNKPYYSWRYLGVLGVLGVLAVQLILSGLWLSLRLRAAPKLISTTPANIAS